MSFGGINTFQQYSTDYGLGHNGIKVSFNFFDGIPEASLLNSLASNELQLIFKLLLKKDEVTKEKALSDLLKLLNDFPSNKYLFADDIFSLCWSQVYPKLLLSNSKNIRVQSHQVTSTLIKVLHKKIAKFLKDFIPPLLLGSCDSDSFVSKSCSNFISSAFNGDSKKISALWTLFHEDILNLVKEVIVVENDGTISDERYIGKEDSQLRYNRLLTSTILLLNTLIASDEKNMDNHRITYKKILSSDSLWNLLSLKNTLFLKGYETVLRLLQLLYRIGYLRSHKEILKISVRKLLKSLAQVNQKNILKVSDLMVSMLDSLNLLNEYKDGKIWTYDKSSKEKLMSFLSVCCSNPHPGYFASMFRFYEGTAADALLNYEHEWLPLWRKSIKALNERSFLGRYGADLLTEFWTYYLKFTDSTMESNAKSAAQSEILETLDSEKSLSKLPTLTLALKDSLPQDFVIEEIFKRLKLQDSVRAADHYLQNLLLLLITGSDTGESLRNLMDIFLDLINQNDITDEKIILINILIRTLVKADLKILCQEYTKYITVIPKLVNENVYDDLAGTVIDYSNMKTTEKGKGEASMECIEEFFNVAITCQISDENIISTLKSMDKHTAEQLLGCQPLKEFIDNYIDLYRYGDDGKLFKTPLISNEIIDRLFESAKVNNLVERFCDASVDLELEQKEHLLKATDFLQTCMFNISEKCTSKVMQIAESFISCNSKITKKLSVTIVEHAKSRDSSHQERLCVDYAIQLLKSSRDNTELFFPPRLIELLDKAVPYIGYRFTLINCLGLNTHLLPTSQEEVDLNDMEELIKLGIFLDTICSEIPILLTDEVSVFLTMVSELAGDFNCLSIKPKESYVNIKNSLLKSDNLKVSANYIILKLTDSAEANEESDVSTALFSLLLAKSASAVIQFYSFRIIYKVLLNEVDSLSVSSLDRLLPSIEKFISNVVRSKTSKDHEYMASAVILSSVVNANCTSERSFMKLRNFLASECIGVGENEIYDKTCRTIILLINFISFSKELGPYTPIAPQRLNMMLKTIEKWFDSDIPYNPQFSLMNLVLLNFFASLISNSLPVASNSAITDLAARLLTDSLTLCELEDSSYLLELRLYSLKLYVAVSTAGIISPEYSTDIFTCLMELCLTDFKSETNNQISVDFYRDLNKVFMKFDVKMLLDYYDAFLDSFLTKAGVKNFNRLRLIMIILRRLVKERQQEAVVEYELEKQQKLVRDDTKTEEVENFEEDNKEDEKFKLPQVLIEKLKEEVPQDYLEYENEYQFLKYLWYWDLVLEFFDSSSYNLRQLFIEQLKFEDMINRFFNFVTDQIDLQETKFWENVESIHFLSYSATGEDFSPFSEDVYVECKTLLAHSLYRMFDNVGSLTANWWLNIKDRSFQSKVEKFVTKFISPILIQHELKIVSQKMGSLTSKDDALSIKINKVTDEVKATYLIDEQKLEISFKLPGNYPLTNIEVIGVSRVGISEQKWKQWILSTQRVITGMNGSVMDSLELFTKNVNLQFSGFEECAICYSILHAVDRKLPTKTCPTCNNKFHGACLYKWFRSSGNNTCPLCRSVIPFRR